MGSLTCEIAETLISVVGRAAQGARQGMVRRLLEKQFLGDILLALTCFGEHHAQATAYLESILDGYRHSRVVGACS